MACNLKPFCVLGGTVGVVLGRFTPTGTGVIVVRGLSFDEL